MPANPLHGVAIVGAYNTKQARTLGIPETELLLDAMRGALRSAGLALADIDGVHCTSSMRPVVYAGAHAVAAVACR